MKIGDEFLEVVVDESTGKVETWVHVLRTIRGGFAYAISKNSSTWGKRSTKAGDYGWLDPIWPEFRTKWKIDGKLPERLASTKLAAIRYAIKSHKLYSLPEDYPDPAMWERTLKTLESMEKRERKG